MESSVLAYPNISGVTTCTVRAKSLNSTWWRRAKTPFLLNSLLVALRRAMCNTGYDSNGQGVAVLVLPVTGSSKGRFGGTEDTLKAMERYRGFHLACLVLLGRPRRSGHGSLKMACKLSETALSKHDLPDW